jgi:ankyrin repeat protein
MDEWQQSYECSDLFTNFMISIIFKNIEECKAMMNLSWSKKKLNEALHEAVLHGSPAIVQLLLKGGADINGRDNEDRTPLMVAIENLSLEVTVALVSAGACVTEHSGRISKSALHLGCRLQFPNSQKCFKIAHLLVEQAGAGVSQRDEVG